MDQPTVLRTMKAHFEETHPPEKLENFASVKAMELFDESIDVVNFLFYLEDELGSRVDISQIGPAMANMTFGELATKLASVLDDQSSSGS